MILPWEKEGEGRGIQKERVMGFEPTNGSLGSYCLTAWRHPHFEPDYIWQGKGCQAILFLSKLRVRSFHSSMSSVCARRLGSIP